MGLCYIYEKLTPAKFLCILEIIGSSKSTLKMRKMAIFAKRAVLK